jgi:hypothetical protein
MKYIVPAALVALAAFLASAISRPVLAETHVEVTPAPEKQTPVLCVLPETGRFVHTAQGIGFAIDDCDPRAQPHLWHPRESAPDQKDAAI